MKKKLIEVALPLDAINKASAREKSIRHGHPSTLHLWWARRPLAAARAVIFAQMVDDPSAYVDVLRADPKLHRKAETVLKARMKLWEEARALADRAKGTNLSVPEPGPAPTLDEMLADIERQRLSRIIEDLVLWENTTNETVLQAARDEIWQSWRRACAENADHPRAKELFDRKKLPAFHDPFAGGGALPLEAQRLGLESYASDLNPVAVLINKAMIEIPPKFAGKPPVNPEARAKYLGARASRPHKDWHSRGYLPHFDRPGLVQHITFRLHDAVPREVVERWKKELQWHETVPAADERAVELRTRIAKYEDAAHGECWLAREDAGRLVEEALLHFDGQRYRLVAWCVMPNHVHVLVETMEGYPLGEVVHAWKSFTAKEANKLLGRTGAFWMPDYYDRFIRDARHLAAEVSYIESNPVKAGLAKRAEDWPFSSAAARRAAGETPAFPGWKGAQGLAEDVRYYGQWMRDEAEKRIGHLYPKIEVTAEMAKERPDLKQYVGKKLTVIAWLWARTVKSPNPAFAKVDVPLVGSFSLCAKAGKQAWIDPVTRPDAKGYDFVVRIGGSPRVDGTMDRTGGICLMSGTPMPFEYIRAEATAGRMGQRLLAIIAQSGGKKVYLSPTLTHEKILDTANVEDGPDGAIPGQALGIRVQLYGIKEYAALFNSRQRVILHTFAALIRDIGSNIAAQTGCTIEYAEAIQIYLALCMGRYADYGSTMTYWDDRGPSIQKTFGLPTLQMRWSYPETNPFANFSGNFIGMVDGAVASIEDLPASVPGRSSQADATSVREMTVPVVVSTDPPYYDNIGYAALSDYFYVWLKLALRSSQPDLFATILTPKDAELIAEPGRHDSKSAAAAFFEERFGRFAHELIVYAHPGFPATIYYAFKQAEREDGNGAVASTGWEVFLGGIVQKGWEILGTWPLRTEQSGGLRLVGRNALASSIVLVCRPRAASAPTATRREFVTALKAELPQALAYLQRGNIAPVDLAQAAIGPGMAVYTRFARVLDAEGKPLTVREALALINQTLDEALAEQEGDFDADSRWALTWFEQSGFDEGEYGVAEQLSKSKNTSVDGMKESGILVSSRGKVRLLKPEELRADWDPATDARLTAWETVHHLIRVLGSDGESAAADLVRKLGAKAEIARELAYRLYTLCERKKRAAEALAYNGLVQSWPEIVRLGRDRGPEYAEEKLITEEGG